MGIAASVYGLICCNSLRSMHSIRFQGHNREPELICCDEVHQIVSGFTSMKRNRNEEIADHRIRFLHRGI